MGKKLPLCGVLRPSRQDVSSELKNRRGAKYDRAHYSAHFGSARQSEMKEVNVRCSPLASKSKIKLFTSFNQKWYRGKDKENW